MSYPTHNAQQDYLEQAARNAQPLPDNPFDPRRNAFPPPEVVNAQMEAARQAEIAAAGPRPSPTIGGGVVGALDVLLQAVDDYRGGRELSLPAVHRAVAELAHLFAESERRGLGMPVGISWSTPTP